MIKQFYEKALPSQGVYCVAKITSGNRVTQRFAESIDDVESLARQFALENANVYVALASFAGYSRKAEDAQFLRSFFIDLDVGEEKAAVGRGYATQGDAQSALQAFLPRVGLPPPVVVNSGTGVHAYWLFDQDIPAAEWKPYAEKFKTLCLENDLHIDPVVTADLARILRCPETFNQKTDPPSKCEVISEELPVYSFDEFKEFLGEIGACEIILYALSVHIGLADISEYGANAIGMLANNNISNSYKLSEHNACDILSQLGNFGFNLRHERCVYVARNVCFAFSQLAEAVNAKRLLECGAPHLIAHLAKLHFKNSEFAVAAVHVICALASLNPIHREELGKNGICQQLVDIIMLFNENIPLLTEGCEAIMHLSLSPNNSDKLCESNAHELILNLFNKKLMEVDFGTEICTGALLHFASLGLYSKKNRSYLIQHECIELLKKAQFSSKASYKARENITALLDLLNNEIAISPELSTNSVSSSMTSNSTATVHSNTHLVTVIHGSEMKGNTIPLHVEVHEVIEYDSFNAKLPNSSSQIPRNYSVDDEAGPSSAVSAKSGQGISPKYHPNGLVSANGTSSANLSPIPQASGTKGVFEI